LIKHIDAKKIGKHLAQLHNRPLKFDLRNATLLNGQYLYTKSRVLNMPFYEEIKIMLEKTDVILNQVTSTVPHPYVCLWNGYDGRESLRKAFYGNPAWDLGIVINVLGKSNQTEHTERFLRQYLNNHGVFITTIELYTGILYAKLNEAINNCYEEEWKRLAENECANIINGVGLKFSEIPTGVLARLGLPGLCRVEG